MNAAYRCLALTALASLGFAWDVAFWRRHKVNFRFIFQLPRVPLPRVREISSRRRARARGRRLPRARRRAPSDAANYLSSKDGAPVSVSNTRSRLGTNGRRPRAAVDRAIGDVAAVRAGGPRDAARRGGVLRRRGRLRRRADDLDERRARDGAPGSARAGARHPATAVGGRKPARRRFTGIRPNFAKTSTGTFWRAPASRRAYAAPRPRNGAARPRDSEYPPRGGAARPRDSE